MSINHYTCLINIYSQKKLYAGYSYNKKDISYDHSVEAVKRNFSPKAIRSEYSNLLGCQTSNIS